MNDCSIECGSMVLTTFQVLLSKVTDGQIVDNLHKRHKADLIYTYIGPVLIAVNPYKTLHCYTERDVEQYHGTAAHENPPHIYAVAETMFQRMLSDEENQCCIISGESGAGKTENSKLLMNYVSAVSGRGGSSVEETKRIILESNPLLEAFGNAKTLRNNNSSRFGKYFEIHFSMGGQPFGGNISNFLLEKSRVVGVSKGERNFHIFYQLCLGSDKRERESYSLAEPSYFSYLKQSGTFDVDGMDDVKEFQEVKSAMKVCGISQENQVSIFKIVSGILHLGNVQFVEKDNSAVVRDESLLEYPAYLLGISSAKLKEKLTSRLMKTGTIGSRSSLINVSLNVQQAVNTRDALAKALYDRIFDWIINSVNTAIQKHKSREKKVSLSVLDIYGFEIFDRNGFEQLCINYVNERLQQVFIELTLKSEQEEYVSEGIKWTPIKYFNNKIVVELIDSKRPAGIMAVLDDVCLQLHAMTDGADSKFVEKLGGSISGHKHFASGSKSFMVKHYAGSVSYECDGFCEANKDTLFKDLIMLAQSTSDAFLKSLFPEDVTHNDKKRPTTAGYKIRNQSNELVDKLMLCAPSYVRCIKPNERKRANDWDGKLVEHQVRYLNLRENINVRRAGFCYRSAFDKFMRRFGILTPETFRNWRGDSRQGVVHILKNSGIVDDQWQLGKSKVFIKAPESLFMLEELREREYDGFARIIQRAFRRYRAQRYYRDCKNRMIKIFFQRKERRRMTLNREFIGDYLDTIRNPLIKTLVGKKEEILYCNNIRKYDRRWNSDQREIVVTANFVAILGYEKIKEGQNKGQLQKCVKRKIPYQKISSISVSPFQDDFLVFHLDKEYDSLIEDVFKTELITIIAMNYEKKCAQVLKINFSDVIPYKLKKTTWNKSTERKLKLAVGDVAHMKVASNNSSVTTILVPRGLPSNTSPHIKATNTYSSSRSRFGPKKTSPRTARYNDRAPQPPPSLPPAVPNVPPPSALSYQKQIPSHGPSAATPSRGAPPPPPLNPAPATPAAAPSPPKMNATPTAPSSGPPPPPPSVPGIPSADPSPPKMNVTSSAPSSVPPPPPAAMQSAAGEARITSPSSPIKEIPQPQKQPQGFGTAGLPAVRLPVVDVNTLKNASLGRSAGRVIAGNHRERKSPAPAATPAVAASAPKNSLPRPKPAVAPPPKPKMRKCKALYDYEAQEADELSIRTNDLITILTKDNEGWWTGMLNGRRGLFPANYVEEV